MGILNSVAAMINRYGSAVTINNGGEITQTRAFVQPIRYKNKIYIGGRRHVLGAYSNEKYLYIGKPSDQIVEDVSVIECAGNKYIVKRQETFLTGDEPVYVWAILIAYTEQMEDEYDSDKTAYGYDY